MRNKTENIFKNKDFSDFSLQFCKVISRSITDFWEQEADIKLQAINDFNSFRDEKIIANIDFFTSQIKVDTHKPIVIRLSREFVENFLDLSLKSKNKFFELTKLTQLEVKILNKFCEFVYKNLKDILIPAEKLKLSEKSNKNINLTFISASKNAVCSKIMVSIPQDRINLSELKKIVAFKDIEFSTSSTFVNLQAGSSKITLNELKNLSVEDIIVLEKSNISKMILISGDYKKIFNVKPDKSLVLDLGSDEDDVEENENIQKYEEVIMDKNLWDDIQIEIDAEFEKVKMTIGELKQITQGQVVDLGSIFDNEISLFVENKKVAKGELLIINDRYAVRINEIFNSKQSSEPQNVQPQAQQKPQQQQAQQRPVPQQAQPRPQQAQARPVPQQAQPRPQQAQARPMPQKPVNNAENEDFDYSDFEK